MATSKNTFSIKRWRLAVQTVFPRGFRLWHYLVVQAFGSAQKAAWLERCLQNGFVALHFVMTFFQTGRCPLASSGTGCRTSRTMFETTVCKGLFKFSFFFFLIAASMVLHWGTSPSFAEEKTFAWNAKTDVPLLVLGTGVSLWGSLRYADMEPRRDLPDKSELLPWDRPFAGNKNKVADRISDWMSLGILLPFAWEGYNWATDKSDAGEVCVFLLSAVEIGLWTSGINLLLRSSRLWPRPELYASGADLEFPLCASCLERIAFGCGERRRVADLGGEALPDGCFSWSPCRFFGKFCRFAVAPLFAGFPGGASRLFGG